MFRDFARTEAYPPLEVRVHGYLPEREILEAYPKPGPVEVKRRKEILTNSPNAFYTAFGYENGGNITISPPWHNVAAIHPATPGHHYAQLAFEGSSLVPVTDGNGTVTGANLVLEPERKQRFMRSIDSLGLLREGTEAFVERFFDATRDLAAVLGESVLIDANGNPARAYLRPTATRYGRWGVTPSQGDDLRFDALLFTWGSYLGEDAYKNGAVGAGFIDSIRYSAIKGKVAGNYAHAGDIGKRARDLGKPNNPIHEGIYWAPFWVDPKTGEKKPLDFEGRPEVLLEQILLGGVPADGPGEDLVFFTQDGKLLYQPKALTHILAGTTREYIISYLAPSLGIPTREQLVTLNDMREHNVVSAAYVGNAVGFCAAKEFRVYGHQGSLAERIPFEITSTTQKLTNRFALELSGRIETAGPLLTEIDLELGKSSRRILDNKFAPWF